MLASLFNKGPSSSPIEMPSLYSTSPLSLANTDSDSIVNQRVANFPLYGSSDVLHFKFEKSDFRILVLEDTGDLLSNDRYFVLYDSDIERNRASSSNEDRKTCSYKSQQLQQRSNEYTNCSKEIKQIAQYLFGSSFQGERKQFSRIHCEPKDLNSKFKDKTLVVRTYHFDANFENSLLRSRKSLPQKKHSASSSKAGSASIASASMPSLNINSKTISTHQNETSADSDYSWTAQPSSKIDYDFSSKNNTPIGICIVLPFCCEEWAQTVGANCPEFDKWLYEIQDLTLKYLKKYYALQMELEIQESSSSTGSSKSSLISSLLTDKSFLTPPLPKTGKSASSFTDFASSSKHKLRHTNKPKFQYFKVDNIQRHKIHFNKLLLQKNFETEKVFLNYYHRINIFLNTPRVITGIVGLEKILKLNLSSPNHSSVSSQNSSHSLAKKPKNYLFLQFCKEVRHWLTVHDSLFALNRTGVKFLPTLLAILYPLRKQLVESKPSDKRSQIVRLVLNGQSDVFINSLMLIISCFLPDVIFKYSILSEKDFEDTKHLVSKNATPQTHHTHSKHFFTEESSLTHSADTETHLHSLSQSKTPSIIDIKGRIPEDEAVDTSYDSIETKVTTRNKLPSLDLSAIDIKSSDGTHSRTNSASNSRSNSRPQTPFSLHSAMPSSPVLSKGRGIQLSSPKTIPIANTSTYDSISVYSSQSENSSYKSFVGPDNFSYFTRSGSISSTTNNSGSNNYFANTRGMVKSSRSSSFVQHNDEKFSTPDIRKKLVKTYSVADLTQKSIRASNSSVNKSKFSFKKISLLSRTPTAILNVNIEKYSVLPTLQSTLARPNEVSMGGHKLQGRKKSDELLGNTMSNSFIPGIERVLAVENSKYRKNYIRDIMSETDIKVTFDENGDSVNISVDGLSSLNEEFSNVYNYDEEDDFDDSEILAEKMAQEYFNPEEPFGKIVAPSSEIYLPPIVGVSHEFIPEFSVQTIKKHENVKQLIINTMKQDLFHNEYIDKCYDTPFLVNDNVDEFESNDKRSITKTIFVNLTTREISEFEILLKLDNDKVDSDQAENNGMPVKGKRSNTKASMDSKYSSAESATDIPASSSSMSHARHSSAFSMASVSSSSAGSSHYSQSSSPTRSSSSMLSLLDFAKTSITNNNPFTFQGKNFILTGNKIVDEQGRLCARDLQASINDMETFLSSFANVQDDMDG